MAFQNKNMSVIAYANGFTLWHYKSDDPIEQICKATYFPKEFVRLCATGDIMIVNPGDNAACIRALEISSDEHITLTTLK